jgi:hypothetical protein
VPPTTATPDEPITPADLARAMHGVIEPINSIAYFSAQLAEAWQQAGLEPFTQGYFGGRSAPMGAVGTSVVAATFYNFHPSIVAMGVPSAWDVAPPARVLEIRAAGMQATFESLEVPTDGVEEATTLARQAAQGISFAGRPLAAANLDVAASGAPLADLWQALTALREHRGDGHVAVLTAEGIRPVDALVLYAAWEERISRRFLQATRGWDDDAWESAQGSLADRGLVGDDGHLTDAGVTYRDQLEARTDELAAPPWAALGEETTRRLWHLLQPIAAAAGAAYPRPWAVPDQMPV